MITLIHLLGAGDLGLRRGSIRAELDRLATADDATIDAALTRAPSGDTATDRVDGAAHHGLRPIAAALFELEAAELGPVEHLVLVATRQEPAHDDDTAPLAALIRQRLEATNGAVLDLGPDARTTIVTADAPTVESMRRAVGETLQRDLPADAEVAVNLASGGTAPFLGVALGCVEAGYPPLVVEGNRQDGPAAGPTVHPLVVDASLPRWLAATGQFRVLLDHVPDAQRRTVERLGAVASLDWAALSASIDEHGPADCPVAQLWVSSAVKPGVEPVTAAAWRWYLEAFEAAITWRLSRADRSALFLFRSYLDARHELAHAEAGVTPTTTSAEVFKKSDVAQRRTPPLDSLYPPGEALARLRWLYDRDKAAAHGGGPDRELLAETRRRWLELVGDHLEHNRLLQAAIGLGYGEALPAVTGTVVVEPVGRRDLQDQRTPMLDAVVDRFHVGEADPAQIQLVVTEETVDAAMAMQRRAQQLGARADAMHPPVSDPFSFVAVRDQLTQVLDQATPWSRYREAALVAGPGTKALLLGSFAAAITAAFDNSRALTVVNAVPDGDGGTRLIETGPAVSARLAHDLALARSLPQRLRWLDLGGAQLLLQVGSARWDHIRAQVDDLVELALYPNPSAATVRRWDLEVVGQAGELAFRLLKPRIRLWERVADVDPWRALYTVVALAERTRPERAWRQRGGPGYPVWQLRNESPYGHSIWSCVPDPSRVVALLRELRVGLEEHLRGQGVPDVDRLTTYGSDVLFDVWRQVQKEVDDVAATIIA